MAKISAELARQEFDKYLEANDIFVTQSDKDGEVSITDEEKALVDQLRKKAVRLIASGKLVVHAESNELEFHGKRFGQPSAMLLETLQAGDNKQAVLQWTGFTAEEYAGKINTARDAQFLQTLMVVFLSS